MEDQFTSYVEFESEDGETITLAVLDYFEYEGETYGILVNEETFENEEDEDGELEVCVLRVITHENGEEEFVEPDEKIVPELQRIVDKIFEEDFECDCDDDDCDCHHHDDDDCGCGCGHHHDN